MAGDNGDNVRGKARRSSDRNTRYGTHVPVMRECIKSLSNDLDKPIYAVEHGMGLASTPFFHSLENVKEITSFERELEWMRCDACASGSNTPHQMILLEDHDVAEQAKFNVVMPERTIALVDGFASQRVRVLATWMQLGIKFIIEHDADVLKHDEVMARKRLARDHGYSAVQYTGQNPETVLFAKGTTTVLTASYVSF